MDLQGEPKDALELKTLGQRKAEIRRAAVLPGPREPGEALNLVIGEHEAL